MNDQLQLLLHTLLPVCYWLAKQDVIKISSVYSLSCIWTKKGKLQHVYSKTGKYLLSSFLPYES